MRLGVIVPQGWTGEYDGWEGARAWERTRDVARQAEALGFESVWLFDHLHTAPRPTDEKTFESFSTLAALLQASAASDEALASLADDARAAGLALANQAIRCARQSP